MTIKERAKVKDLQKNLDDEMEFLKSLSNPVTTISDVKEILKKYVPDNELMNVLCDIINYKNYTGALTAWLELQRVLDK